MAEPAIRRLLAGDDTSAFRCGDPEYDLFLQRYAGQNQERLFVGTTYAALDGPRVVGYVTVAVGHVDRDDVPSQARGGLPRYPLPVLRLARLAIDEGFQGRGLGRGDRDEAGADRGQGKQGNPFQQFHDDLRKEGRVCQYPERNQMEKLL